MKGFEVSEENFEALLAYDDLFLDYFNAFLQLPAFPQPLFYNRLTGTFQEVDQENTGFLYLNSAQYGPSDDERERIYEWAKFDRLPLFLRSNLLREYKLCKLLIRPLDERVLSSHQSNSGINGYSRQTTSYATSSLENSIHRSTYENIDNTDSWPEIRQSLLGRYVRPGSRAWSLPPMIGLGKYIRPYSHSEEARPNSEDQISSNDHSTLNNKKKTVITPDLSIQYKDISKNNYPKNESNTQIETEEKLSSKVSHSSQKQVIHIPNPEYVGNSYIDGNSNASFISKDIVKTLIVEQEKIDEEYAQVDNNEDVNVESFVDLEDDLISEVQTEAELRDVEDKLHMTFQQLKEEALGTITGIREFCHFLKDTIGNEMLNFWLDCEDYLQNVQFVNEEPYVKNKLFRLREIQDKYKNILSEKAKQRIKKYGNKEEISDKVFLKTQYDILRRLRTYWLPRFLIHTEKTGGYRVQSRMRSHLDMTERSLPKITFLPSLSLVKSLPIRAQSCLRLAQSNHTWDVIAKGEHKREQDIQPRMLFEPQNIHNQSSVLKVNTGLAYEKAAGGPFINYLKRHKKLLHIANLLFWQDVTDYSESEDRLADRMLCMGHAWFIFNKYIAFGTKWNIGIAPRERDEIHQKLLITNNYVSSSIFDTSKEFSVQILQKEWLRYLKEDLKTFLLWRQRPDDCIIQNYDIDTPPLPKNQRTRKQIEKRETHDAAAISIKTKVDKQTKSKKNGKHSEDYKPKPKKVKAKSTLLKKTGHVTPKKVQKTRKKPPKEVSTKSISPNLSNDTTKDEDSENELSMDEDPDEENQDIKFQNVFRNRALMTLFKRYMAEVESEEQQNLLNLYLEADAYMRVPEARKEQKGLLGKQLLKTYLDPTSNKYISLSSDIRDQIELDGEKPRTETLKLIMKTLQTQLEDHFKSFWMNHLENLERSGVIGDNLSNQAKVDLALRSESTHSLMLHWRKRKKGKGNESGRMMPNSQDKYEFQEILNETARGGGAFLPKIEHFRKYLIMYGESEGFPLLENDLIFYIEAQRFKDANHPFADSEFLKKKVEIIVNCFIECEAGPPKLQIDINNEIATKIVRQYENFMKDRGKDIHNANLFEDAQNSIFKELLPYWAGFIKHFDPNKYDHQRPPTMTKSQKLTKDRLKLFLEMQQPDKEYFIPVVIAGGRRMTFSITEGVQWKDIEHGEDVWSEPNSNTPYTQFSHNRVSTDMYTSSKQYRNSVSPVSTTGSSTGIKLNSVLINKNQRK